VSPRDLLMAILVHACFIVNVSLGQRQSASYLFDANLLWEMWTLQQDLCIVKITCVRV